MVMTVNSDFTLLNPTQFMRLHENTMWLKKPKIRADYIGYKNNFKNYIERTAQFNPIIDIDTTLNRVILNKVKKGYSFFYKCLTYLMRIAFNWSKQRAYLGKNSQ